MRRLEDGDRLIASEATAALKDAPEATLVLEGTAVTEQSDTEIDVAAGEILVDRDVVDVSQTVEELDLPEAAGGDETHYRYVTVSRDAQGAVVLTNGAVGTIDSEGEISAPVPAQPHPEGNVYLATVLVDEDRILDIYDGRALLESRVEDFRTQGGSGTVPVSQGDGTISMESRLNLSEGFAPGFGG